MFLSFQMTFKFKSSRETCVVYLKASKIFNIGKESYAQDLVWLKLDMVTGITKFYIFLVVGLAMTLIQDQRPATK